VGKVFESSGKQGVRGVANDEDEQQKRLSLKSLAARIVILIISPSLRCYNMISPTMLHKGYKGRVVVGSKVVLAWNVQLVLI
jgi:hypothetical protein